MSQHELTELLRDHRRYHTEYQMDRFITAKSGGTTWGMYRQALRELSTRHRQVKLAHIAVREQELDLEDVRNGPPGERQSLDAERKAILLEEARESLADKERELQHFHRQASWLRSRLGKVDEERARDLEQEFWAFHARKRAALEMSCNGSLSTATLETIWCLDHSDTLEILAELSSGPKALMAWLETHQGYAPANAIEEGAPQADG